jgi:hypothetical protein
LGAVGSLSRAGVADGPEGSPKVLPAHAVEREVDTEVCNEEDVRYVLENRKVFFLAFGL